MGKKKKVLELGVSYTELIKKIICVSYHPLLTFQFNMSKMVNRFSHMG